MTSSTRWKVLTYTAVLFAAGAVCGALMLPRKPEAPAKQTKLWCANDIACQIRKELRSALDLTPEQMAKFEPLIKQTSEELEASHHDCLNRINAAMENLHTQICKDLKPEQKSKLKKLKAERLEKIWDKYGYPVNAGGTITN